MVPRSLRLARAGEPLYHCCVSAALPPGDESRPTTLVLGVGNAMKCDDGVGPYVAGRLSAMACSASSDAALHLSAIDCGTTPENHTSVVRRLRPDLLVIVDAADMGLAPGDCRIIPPERAGSLGLSTHSMPLSLFVSYVSDLASRIVLVGVQPRTMVLGSHLSREVLEAGDALVETLLRGGLESVPRLD